MLAAVKVKLLRTLCTSLVMAKLLQAPALTELEWLEQTAVVHPVMYFRDDCDIFPVMEEVKQVSVDL